MTSYRPDPKILMLGNEFYDAVEPARFPRCTPRYLNERWAGCAGLQFAEAEWVAHGEKGTGEE